MFTLKNLLINELNKLLLDLILVFILIKNPIYS